MNELYLIGYSVSGGIGSNQNTCGSKCKHIFVQILKIIIPFIIPFHSVSGLSADYIAGIVIICFVGYVCCALIFIVLPISICCCLGVGIGAATSSSGTRYTYSNI